MNILNIENQILLNDCILHGRCVKKDLHFFTSERSSELTSASGMFAVLFTFFVWFGFRQGHIITICADKVFTFLNSEFNQKGSLPFSMVIAVA